MKLRSALITGSAKGIGRSLLLALAKDGLDVALHYQNSCAEAETTARQASQYGGKVVSLQADVTVASEARNLVDKAHAELGSLDVLINNVGNYFRGPLSSLDDASWHNMLNSNLHTTFYTCQHAVPLMRERGLGRIVNIGYAGAEYLKARPGIVAYQIAKTGVILYSKALAHTEAASGITVNVISPGVMENSDSKPVMEVPGGRLGRLEELVAATRFLLSRDADYITGITLEVAGGWNL
jgi:3-oxoacyl-[acyl-carrier protein] reductase